MTPTATADATTTDRILAACREQILTGGAASVSTRKVADAAGVPLSQIHYHFGSKRGLMLATFAAEDRRLLDRQAAMYAGNEPFAVQWRRACDHLDQDLESGYVRMLQEMITAGYSDDELRAQVRDMLGGWSGLITEALRYHYAHGLRLGGLTADEACALIAAVFLGAETLCLMGQTDDATPVRDALRALEPLLAAAQQP
ncbi:TetR/AcrR family transcriptional regulator [Demequina lignilytica]|uniref:TetR/AcrR family transcriptional regulator n=1 Tax=Demequina lignilytica TaxID=3051663 RepID=A0AAW7M5W5_9MICO|nr:MULTISPECIES: TetR/AcrR family transcriptional regulator [unclassified Demequina]MDN4477328.1 TetR/AcrR family transcriptional regulator [Demequina sp. SYSU T00039-1]MDN4483181.1 TetR/AcrR family transcriptional regulator [Demequina sp. SYSU T0a273]MDN4487501.1 TetR/AcrR family transcriptional regulator [Demequina sp. SYSU T00039]MDN4491029.1 TetR/AcrR family transcriptional regulator [Demequina sp. SYSU T00068]